MFERICKLLSNKFNTCHQIRVKGGWLIIARKEVVRSFKKFDIDNYILSTDHYNIELINNGKFISSVDRSIFYIKLDSPIKMIEDIEIILEK